MPCLFQQYARKKSGCFYIVSILDVRDFSVICCHCLKAKSSIKDLKSFSKENELYEKLLKLILSRTDSADLKKIYGYFKDCVFSFCMSEPLVIMGYCDFASSDKIVAALSFLTASGVRYKFD